MGLFGSSPHLSWEELEDALRQLPNLKTKEQEYILGAFSAYRHNGIDKREIEKVIKELRWNNDDPISEFEAKQVKQKLLDQLV